MQESRSMLHSKLEASNITQYTKQKLDSIPHTWFLDCKQASGARRRLTFTRRLPTVGSPLQIFSSVCCKRICLFMSLTIFFKLQAMFSPYFPFSVCLGCIIHNNIVGPLVGTLIQNIEKTT